MFLFDLCMVICDLLFEYNSMHHHHQHINTCDKYITVIIIPFYIPRICQIGEIVLTSSKLLELGMKELISIWLV